jgi:hypothetical protein
MAYGTTTYSFKDLTGAINSPLAGPFILAGGNLGSGKITVTMDHEWTEQDVAADAAVMVSASPGQNGTVEIMCQQTSSINAYLKHGSESSPDGTPEWKCIGLGRIRSRLPEPRNGRPEHLHRSFLLEETASTLRKQG